MMSFPLVDLSGAAQGFTDGPAPDEEAERMAARWPQGPEETCGGLTTIQVEEGQGQFRLTACLSKEEQAHVRVDMAPRALRICSGRVHRWVPLPEDVLAHEAVVLVCDGLLTVSMPMTERPKIRHVVHVW
jgi:hypothetical protein